MSQSNFTPIDDLIDQHNSTSPKSHSVTVTKEGEPITISTETNRKQEVTVTENEPKIEDHEVKEYINVQNQQPSLSPELKKAGLNVIDSASMDPKYKVVLPISDEKVLEGLDKPLNTSWRWLAEFARFFLVQAHITLKKIHGKVVRVIQK